MIDGSSFSLPSSSASFARDAAGAPPADGYPRVYWLDEQTVAIDWFGKIDENKCHHALSGLRRLLAERKPRYFFSDTSHATHYVPAVRRGATDILRQLREVGVREMVTVSSSPPIRIFAAAVAHVTGLTLKTFVQRHEAIGMLQARRRLQQ